MALPGIVLTEVIEVAYSTQDYLAAAQPLINASTNIYIIIIPQGQYLTRFVDTASLSQGFFIGSKAFFYMNADVAVANQKAMQGGIIFSQTNGSPTNVTAWTARAENNVDGYQLTGAATTYDTVIAIAKAIRRRAVATGARVLSQDLITELASTNENGYSGPLSYDANRYRAVQTYNFTNIFTKNANTGVTTLRTAFTWDGALRATVPAAANLMWPGNSQTPTGDRIMVYPVAFISSMFETYAQMLAADVIVPVNASLHRSMTRFAQVTVNNLVLKEFNVQISVPPLNDNGTVAGAVRISTTIASTTYVAMIATWDSPNTRIIQGVLSAYGVPQISYSATDPALSNKAIYPTHVRVVPSDAKQIRGILQMVNHFKWAQVSTISCTSTYGQGLDATWGDQLAAFPDISVGRSGVILEDGTGLTEVMKNLQTHNVNIVVLLIDPKLYTVALATMRELEYAPRAVIVPDRFFDSFIWQHYLEDSGFELSDFAGWVGLAPAGGNYDGPSAWSYLSELVYNTTTGPSAAAYPGLATAWRQAPDYFAYILDSFYVVAEGIKQTILLGEDPKSGASMMRGLAKVDALTATGQLAFDENYDRKLNPFVARFVRANGSFEIFGSWDETEGFVQANRVVWPGGSTTVPIAIEPRTVKWLHWTGAPGIVLASIAGVGILLVVVMTCLVVIWRESPVIVSSTYPFLLLILFGAGLGFGSMFTWIGEPRSWICALRIWLPPLAFAIMVTPLLAKTWRLHRIFTLASLKTTPIPLWKLIVMVVCLTLIQVAICVAWVSAGTIQPSIVNDKNDAKVAYKICTLNQANRIASYVTYGYLGLLLLIGAYYAFRVRNLPKDFNESRWIGFSIYNTLLFSVIIVILGYALTDFRVTVLILICVCTLAIVYGVVGLMMAPKLWTLIMNPHRRTSSGSGGLTYSGAAANSSPHGSKYQSSFRGEGSSPNLYGDDGSANGTSGPNTQRRHDFSRKRGEPSAHSKDSSKDKSRDRTEAEMKPLNGEKRASKKPEKTSTSSTTD